MKVSVDGGAIEGKGIYGTKVFSQNLKQALLKYDKKNQYYFYDFKTVKPKLFWLKIGVSLAEWNNKPDVFLGLNQALPLYFHKKAIVFSHGLSFYFYPQFYSEKQRKRLNNQLKEIIKRADKIIVSSKKVKEELVSIKKDLKDKIVILPFGVPFDCLEDKRLVKREKFFLVVGDDPIKNLNFIAKVFNQFKKNFSDYRLIKATKTSRKQLINLYQKASALLTASYYESFNFPVVEALSLGCPVVGLSSAIIPELKDYVNLAKNEKEFFNLMINIPKKPDDRLIFELKNKFNWKNYVKRLVELF